MQGERAAVAVADEVEPAAAEADGAEDREEVPYGGPAVVAGGGPLAAAVAAQVVQDDLVPGAGHRQREGAVEGGEVVDDQPVQEHDDGPVG